MSTNGNRWEWTRPEKIDIEEFVTRAHEFRRTLVAWIFALTILMIVVGQMVMVFLAGFGLMQLPKEAILLLTGSVPIEVLGSVTIVARKAI